MDVVIVGICLMCFLILFGTKCLVSITTNKSRYNYDDHLDIAI